MAVDIHRESKEAAADTVTDVAIGVAGIGGVISVVATGGASICL